VVTGNSFCIFRKKNRREVFGTAEDSKKNWKFAMDDIKERKFWERLPRGIRRDGAEQRRRSGRRGYVVPADNKWYGRLVVASAIIEALDGLNLAFPDVDKEKKKELETIREALVGRQD